MCALIGKTPIVVNDSRGFLRQPLRAALHRRSLEMLMEGLPPAMIENTAKWRACRRAAVAVRRGSRSIWCSRS